MRPPTPCIERLPTGVGCPNYAEPDSSRCAQHGHLAPKGRSKGTTTSWRKARQAALRRSGNRCEKCGRTEQQARADGTWLEVHHLTGSHLTPGRSLERTEHPLEELQVLCRKPCHLETLRKKTRPTYAQYAAELRAKAKGS